MSNVVGLRPKFGGSHEAHAYQFVGLLEGLVGGERPRSSMLNSWVSDKNSTVSDTYSVSERRMLWEQSFGGPLGRTCGRGRGRS
jgi:hypothetical protein